MKKNQRAFILGMLAMPILMAVLTLAFADTASVPNMFVANTPAVAEQVNANFDALVATINANTPKITHIQYSDQFADPSISSTFEKLHDLGTFTKQSDDSDILVTLNTHISAVGAAGDYARFQIRIDGVAPPGPGTGPSAMFYLAGVTHSQSISRTERFPGLVAGPHTVELWIAGTCATMLDNQGGFSSAAIVTELFSN